MRIEGICRYVEAAKCTSNKAGSGRSHLASIITQPISIVIAARARLPSYGRFRLLGPASSFSRRRFHCSFAGSARFAGCFRHLQRAESSSDDTQENQENQENVVQMFVETKPGLRGKWKFEMRSGRKVSRRNRQFGLTIGTKIQTIRNDTWPLSLFNKENVVVNRMCTVNVVEH